MKTLEGIIISAKMQKTVVVKVVRKVAHPFYKKLLKRNKKYKVDSTGFSVSEGDRVKIVETKPISKDKYFKIVEILKDKDKSNKNLVIAETQGEIETQKIRVSKRRKKK